MIFYLGTHKANWLAEPRFAGTPLFVSRRTLSDYRKLPRAVGVWALDSGGFSELSLHGRWTVTPAQYVADVRRFRDEIGGLAWAAPQDWMVESEMLKRTGLTVEEHQRRTVENFLELRELAPDLPIAPVLQGWTTTDYWRCADLYARAGVKLEAETIVGVGTLCRRQGTRQAETVLRSLASSGMRLHGFGFKVLGLRRCSDVLVSADSLAWSSHARRRAPIEGHDQPGPGRPRGHKNCANCPDYALHWMREVLCIQP